MPQALITTMAHAWKLPMPVSLCQYLYAQFTISIQVTSCPRSRLHATPRPSHMYLATVEPLPPWNTLCPYDTCLAVILATEAPLPHIQALPRIVTVTPDAWLHVALAKHACLLFGIRRPLPHAFKPSLPCSYVTCTYTPHVHNLPAPAASACTHTSVHAR